MSIYDKASLVLIPSGTKTSKVYSQKPTNGDGDFTFSRSTAATRVNASGNIEKETQNILRQSNTFNVTAIWGNGGSDYTITSGQSGYDGSSDAWLISKASTANNYISQGNISASGVNTTSVYAKAGTADGLMLYTAVGYARWNLSTGVQINLGGAPIDTNIESIGSGWYRCSVTTNGSIPAVLIKPVNSSGVDVAGTIYIQDAQLEQGLVARDYIETTTTAIYGGITDNVPRLDYTDSSCPALLLEPQRTNSVIHSEYLQNALTNGQVDITFTPNYGISPEGVKNSTRIQFADNSAYAYSSVTITTNAVASMYVKGTSGERFRFGLASSAASGGLVHTFSGEWERISNTSSTATQLIISSYGGTALDFEAYGLQLEQDATYPTSYIPTYGSAVTRNADDAEADNISDLIGQTEGTFLIDAEVIAHNGDWIGIYPTSGSAYQNSFLLGYFSGAIRAQLYAGGTAYVYTQSTTNEKRYKIAITYTSSSYKVFIDGVKVHDVSKSTSFAVLLDRLSVTGANLSGKKGNIKHKQVLVLPTALTDQEAIDLTTL